MFQFIETKLFLIITIFVAIYAYLKYYVYNYWKQRDVPHDTPSIPFGNITFPYLFGKTNLGKLFENSYKKFNQYRFHGFFIFNKPILVINDPELVRAVLVKDFAKFCDRGVFINEKIDPLLASLFFQTFEKWQQLRAKFSPTFTPGKIKKFFPLIMEVSNEMIKTCDSELINSDILEVKDIMARYTVDIICSVIYGLNYNSLKNPNNDFRRFGLRAQEMGRITLLFTLFYPEILDHMFLPFNHKEVRKFFTKIFIESANYRKKEKITRNDFMDLLIQLMEKGNVENNEISSVLNKKENKDLLNEGDAAAQAFLFFLAGYETASTVGSFCLLELAMNPEIQEKLQQEIDEVAESSDSFTYDNIMEMKYLDMVFSETLRKYPPVGYLNRICMEDFPIPNSNYTIPKGMRVIISVNGLHHNPEFFPNPSKFDPTRFTKENLASRSPYVHLGFGEGPRNCIGKKFGILETKQAIVQMLRNYTFRICDKTNLPIVFNTESFAQSARDGIYLRFKKRK